MTTSHEHTDGPGNGKQVPAEAARPHEGQAVVTVDDANAVCGYANFFRVLGTAEEIVLDLGLDPQPFAQGERTVKVGQRIVINHFTAKRLLTALNAAIQRHERTFGVLETDVMKRVKSKT